jgi:hypothetical protein
MAWPTEAGSVARVAGRHPAARRRALRSRLRGAEFLGAIATGGDVLRVHGSNAPSPGAGQVAIASDLGGNWASTERASFRTLGAVARLTVARIGGSFDPGLASVESDGAGSYRYTAPGQTSAGAWTAVPSGGGAYWLPSGSAGAGLRVTRTGAAAPAGPVAIKILETHGGAFGARDATSAQRAAGLYLRRAWFLRNAGAGALAVKVYLNPLGTARALAANYANAGAVTATLAGDGPRDWPECGFAENENTGEVLFYSARSATALTVPAYGRDAFSDGAPAAGTIGDNLVPISGAILALETPVAGAITLIPSETSVPFGLSWAHPWSAADPAVLTATLASGGLVGLWMTRITVAGQAAAAIMRNEIIAEATDAEGNVWRHVLRGTYRLPDDSIDGYELYRGTDADPDFTAAPYETFAALPHTTAALGVGHEYRFALRYRNRYNLLSQNRALWSVTVAADASDATPPSSPAEWLLASGAAGAPHLTARYDYLSDAAAVRGDTWAVWITTDGSAPNPAAAAT